MKDAEEPQKRHSPEMKETDEETDDPHNIGKTHSMVKQEVPKSKYDIPVSLEGKLTCENVKLVQQELTEAREVETANVVITKLNKLIMDTKRFQETCPQYQQQIE